MPLISTLANASVCAYGFTRGGALASGFIAKFADSWATNGFDYITPAAVDSLGNVWVGVGANANSPWRQDIFKISSVPALTGQWQIGNNDNKEFRVSVSSDDNLLVATSYLSRYIVKKHNGTTPTTNIWGNSDASGSPLHQNFVQDASGNVYGSYTGSNFATQFIKQNSSGTFQWGRTWTNSSGNGAGGASIAIDSSGNSYNKSYDDVICKRDSAGNRSFLFRSNINAFSAPNYYTLVTDSSTLTGITNKGSAIAIWQYPLTGGTAVNWIYNTTTTSSMATMAIDSSGNTYVVHATAPSSTTLYITKFNTSGSIVWQRQITSTFASGVANSTVPYIVIKGTWMYVSYNEGPSTGSTRQPMLWKLPTDGSATGSYVLGSYTYTYATASNSWTSTTATFQDLSGFYSDSSYAPGDTNDTTALSSITTASATTRNVP